MHCPKSKIVLVGLKSDLITESTISEVDIHNIQTKIGAEAHIQCSAKRNQNVKSVAK